MKATLRPNFSRLTPTHLAKTLLTYGVTATMLSNLSIAPQLAQAKNRHQDKAANTSQTMPVANTMPTIAGTAVDGVIAVVNDTPILKSQLDQAVTQTAAQLRTQKQAVPPAQQLYAQVLNQMITRQIQLDIIKRQGIRADDNQINDALSNIARQNGATSLSQFQQSLDSQRAGSYQALRQQVSDDLAIQTLQQQQLTRRVKISDQDIDLFLKSPESNVLDQSQYRTLHIRVPYSSSSETGAITNKQRQQAIAVAEKIANDLQTESPNINKIIESAQANYAPQIQGGDMGYHPANELPTEVAKEIVALDVGQVSRPLVTPEGVNVIKLVDKRGGKQQIIDQWLTRHILISPSVSLSSELAKQQIDSIYEQLRRGADFATLAATYSNDTGSASNGGSLGWVSEGQMVPEFEAMMKRTAVHDFSTPFQSQFGWHILKVEDKRQQDVTDTYRRNVARELLFQRLAPQALEDWIHELRSQSYVKIMN